MKSAKFGNSDDLFWLKTVDTVPLRVFTAAVFFSYHEASVLLYFNVSKLSILGCSFRSIVVHLQMFLLMHPQCVCAHESQGSLHFGHRRRGCFPRRCSATITVEMPIAGAHRRSIVRGVALRKLISEENKDISRAMLIRPQNRVSACTFISETEVERK